MLYYTILYYIIPHHSILYYTIPMLYHLTIIPRTRVEYELLDSGRGAEHRVGYHKLVSNKREIPNIG